VVAVKPLVPVAVAGVMLGVVPGAALAQGTERTVETNPVTFEIKAENCPHLAAGTTISGTGTLTSVTWTTKRRRITTVTNISSAHGTATDQAGAQYTFVYSNSFRIHNTKRRPRLYSGPMTDYFALQGAAGLTLSNGFLARFTTNNRNINRFAPINAFGDPIDFEAGTARCDPL
jgi:hypothetical protein